jgi:hypothetical protein
LNQPAHTLLRASTLRAGLGTSLKLVLVLSLALRSLIAPGYMPQGADGDGFLALCHGGLNPAVAARLFGHAASHGHHEPAAGHQQSQHQHHRHHHHPRTTPPATADEAAVGLSSTELCPLGDGLGSAFLIEFQTTLERLEATGPSIPRSSALVLTPGLSPFLARGPPQLSLLS